MALTPEIEPRLPIEPKAENSNEVGQIERQEEANYLEKVEHEPQAVVDTSTGQPLLTPLAQKEVEIILSEDEVKQGLHHKAGDSVRWLAEWCVRVAKKAVVLGAKVVYRK